MKIRRLKKIAILPTLITLGNGTCGFLAICAIAANKPVQAAWTIILGTIFDAMDGKIARMAGANSDFGAQLDSLADSVSYGAAPAFLIWKLLINPTTHHKFDHFVTLCCTLYFLCAILRLARYNVEMSHEEDGVTFFKGLPSPAAGIMIAAGVILHFHLTEESGFDYIMQFLPLLAVGCGGLMVSRMDYQHIPNILLRGRRPFHYLVMVIFTMVIIIMEPQKMLALLASTYVISGFWAEATREAVQVVEEQVEEEEVL